MEKIHIVLASDENYIQHAAVTITSVLVNKASPYKVIVHFIGGGISPKSLTLLEQCATKYGAEFVYHQIDDKVFEDFYVSRHITKAAYYRLMIPMILDSTLEKAIYLDTDMIVRHDIGELWETDIRDYFLGAVLDKRLNEKRSLISHLEMPPNEPYFNSGLLLMNLVKWREHQISEKAIQYIYSHGDLPFHDQDALNGVLWGKWYPLDSKWNVITALFHQYYKLNRKTLLSLEQLEAVKDPYIVHFTGPVKPWHFACAIPYTQDYYKYLRMTPWKDYRPTDINLKSFGRRMEWIPGLRHIVLGLKSFERRMRWIRKRAIGRFIV